MTTTLRPVEPLQHGADGVRSRRYQVCVNGRPVGGIRLSTHPEYGPSVARFQDLRIDERDRRRGRGTVAALAAEEVVRGWGCRRIEISVPYDAGTALRLATALGYVLRSRTLAKPLKGARPVLPAGSTARPLTAAEFGPWLAGGRERFARHLMAAGVPEAQAYAKTDEGHARFLPDGAASREARLSVLEHEGTPVGTLWLGLWPETAYVLDVETAPERRGRGHGRTLMLLAEAQAAEHGEERIGLNVFEGNVPAERLYESLGYRAESYHLYKPL
ncbi:GNAT family N-acetyltransferase [Streptomyces mangrovisoli]|uniref:GNAT family N-acetyltransferase n=1 Tax=Streptomyces mangrovisoli TaxID=1428628 RepID=A0A1J4NW56_9ACTN|nr:GNAT family N-acetyltransferase [Streptomyces mangrovisoli]OIJ66729.1 GNAT family N-acetyltransferase [Streptomyces mangrovisoli]